MVFVAAKLVGRNSPTAMNETLAIGNGRIGALVFGETSKERLVLNDVSLWTGDENTEGSYQCLANMYINLPGHENPSNYYRDLELNTATSHVNYTANGVNYHREYFASNPNQVIVARLTANKRGAYTGSIELNDMHGAITTANQNQLTAAGTLNNGLEYESRVKIINDGGSIKIEDNKLVFTGCNSITLFIAAGTNYVFNYDKKYMGVSPHAAINNQISLASSLDYPTLKNEHIKNFQSIFKRVSLNLGKSSSNQIAKPTGIRKVDAAQTTDPEL
jgi:alpha-L-fucosidase 2